MKNINWKVRFSNPMFILELILAVLIPILGYAGLTAQDITTWEVLLQLFVDAVQNPYVLGMVAVSVYNAIVDPTTKGVKDSTQALLYKIPKKEG